MTKTNGFHDIKAYLEANELEQAQRIIDEEKQKSDTPLPCFTTCKESFYEKV